MTEADTQPRPTLDQRRAAHAWEAVQKAKKLDRSAAQTYGGEAKKLPMRIMAAGLGHALAFIVAKAAKKKGLQPLHDDVTDWVIRKRPLKARAPESLIESIVQADAGFLRLATDETLAYLQWLNRFAEAEGLTDDAERGD